MGVTSNHNNNWRLTTPASSSITVGTDGTLFESTATTARYYVPQLNNSDILLDTNSDWSIEIDLMKLDTTSKLGLWICGKFFRNLHDYIITENDYTHFKWTVISKQAKIYVNNEHIASYDINVTSGGTSIELLSGGCLKLKNFIIYEI